MNQLNYFHLILRYPSLRSYISESFLKDRSSQLFDFLIALEIEDPPIGLYHA